MSVLTLPDTIGDINRCRQIASIIYEEGFPFLLEKIRLKLKWAVTIKAVNVEKYQIYGS